MAVAAQMRPNTLTSIIRHGGETDTRTLVRVARVLEVDIAELLMSPEQRRILRAHRERAVDRVTASVVEQVEKTVRELVQTELVAAGLLTDLDLPAPSQKKPEVSPPERGKPLEPVRERTSTVAAREERTDTRRTR